MKAIRTLSPEDVASAFAKDAIFASKEFLSVMDNAPEELLVAACVTSPDFVFSLKERGLDGFKNWDAACSADPYLVDAAPLEIQAELAARIVERSPKHLDAIPYDLRSKELCFDAISGDGEALEFVPSRFKDESLCWAASKSSVMAFKHFPRSLWDSFSEIRQDGLPFWRLPEWIESARLKHPAVEEWIPEDVLAYQAPPRADAAPKNPIAKEAQIVHAFSRKGMLLIGGNADAAEGLILAPDRQTKIPFGGKNFNSIESAFGASLKAFPDMAKDELKLLSTIYLKACEADESMKDALAVLGEKEIMPDFSYSDKRRHPANPFLIAAAIDRVRAHYGFKVPPVPYSLDGSPFESPFKPGYLYEPDEAARKYSRWLSASVRARISKQGMEDIARIVAIASSGMKVCIHSQFPESAKAFAKFAGSLCEKAKTAKDLDEAIGEPCPLEAAYVRHKSLEEAKAERKSGYAFKAHPRSRVVRFTPETYILATHGVRIYGTEKVSADEMKALLLERKDWKTVFGVAPIPAKIVLDIDGRILPGAREISFESAKASLKLARPVLQYDGEKLSRPLSAGSIEEMFRRAKDYPSAKLLQYDAKAIDTAILVLDGGEAGKAEPISFHELHREAGEETSFFICSNGGSARRAVRSLNDIEREMRVHPKAALYAYKSLASAPLKNLEEFEHLHGSLQDAAILRRPASVKAQIVRERPIVENDEEQNALSNISPAVAAVKGAGVRDLPRAAKLLLERTETGDLDGLTASEARHATGKIAALAVLKDFQALKEPSQEKLFALGNALDKFGIDYGYQLHQDDFPRSQLKDGLAKIARELNSVGFSLPNSEIKAAKAIIRDLKAEAVMQADSAWRKDSLRESYNDSLDIETEESVTIRIPKSSLDGILRDSPSLSEKGEEGDMAIFESSYLMPDREALTGDGVDDEMEEQYYGADAIRAMDMPVAQIEREMRGVFSISDSFSPEPSFITALEKSESIEELQERHDFEDREPSVPPSFIHFDERRRNAPKSRMHR